MPQLLAFSIIALILFIGDAISTRTKSWLPSVFVCAILFMLGYWTFFPQDIVALAGFQTPIVFLAMYLLITNMGTLLSFAELSRQWRTVVVSLAGIGGIIAALLTLGVLVLDYQTVIVATPPLVGGVVAQPGHRQRDHGHAHQADEGPDFHGDVHVEGVRRVVRHPPGDHGEALAQSRVAVGGVVQRAARGHCAAVVAVARVVGQQHVGAGRR